MFPFACSTPGSTAASDLYEYKKQKLTSVTGFSETTMLRALKFEAIIWHIMKQNCPEITDSFSLLIVWSLASARRETALNTITKRSKFGFADKI